jgi:hypothetical protein
VSKLEEEEALAADEDRGREREQLERLTSP